MDLTSTTETKQAAAPKKRKAKNYLNNGDMMIQLKLSKERGRLTEEMGKMFMLLAKRYANHPRFSRYSYNDDMQSAALLILAKVWKGFDETKYNNPFAYFTQIVHHAFHQFNNTERRERDVRDSLLVAQGRNPSFNYSERMAGVGGADDAYGDNDYMEHHDADSKYEADVENFDASAIVVDEELVKDIHDAIAPEGETNEEEPV